MNNPVTLQRLDLKGRLCHVGAAELNPICSPDIGSGGNRRIQLTSPDGSDETETWTDMERSRLRTTVGMGD